MLAVAVDASHGQSCAPRLKHVTTPSSPSPPNMLHIGMACWLTLSGEPPSASCNHYPSLSSQCFHHLLLWLPEVLPGLCVQPVVACSDQLPSLSVFGSFFSNMPATSMLRNSGMGCPLPSFKVRVVITIIVSKQDKQRVYLKW